MTLLFIITRVVKECFTENFSKQPAGFINWTVDLIVDFKCVPK